MGLRYGQGKYGTFLYGEAEAGFQFKIQISDASGNIKAIMNNEVAQMNWTFLRNGGCSRFSIRLKRQFDNFDFITNTAKSALYDVQVYIKPGSTSTSILYYRGYITRIRPNLREPEEMIINGTGYVERLNEIQVQTSSGAPKTYTSTTLSAVVNSIINDFITPNTPITAGTVDTFSTTVASIKFNGSVHEALTKLADIAGAEWGVDRNRQLYFRSASNTVGFRFKIGYDISELQDEYDYSDIVNRVYVEGGEVSGAPFRYVKSDATSIANYGLKEKRVTNSAVVDSTVAEVLANSILTEKSDKRRQIRITLPFNKELIESSNPLKLIEIIYETFSRRVYGTFKYGEGLYGQDGVDVLRAERIDYELRDVSLFTEIEFNEGKPDLIDQFEALEFELEQQRTRAGV